MFTIIGGDGKEYGPVSAEQIRAWIVAGRADGETKARAEGAEEWQRLADFPEFSPAAPAPRGVAAAAGGAELATRTSRLGAYLLDMVFGCLCLLPGAIALGVGLVTRVLHGDVPDDLDYGRFSLLGLGLLFVVVVQTWMLAKRGQTLGKRIAGIRIVRYRDEAHPGFLRAVLLRSWLIGLLSLVPTVGQLFSFAEVLFIFGPQRRCLHDRIADTKVIVGQPPAA